MAVTTKWLNLSSVGAKLERLQDDRRVPYLLLTVADPFQVDDAKRGKLSEIGWVEGVGDDAARFANYGEFSRLSEVIASLEPLWKAETLREMVAAPYDLTQGEQVLTGAVKSSLDDENREQFPSNDSVAANLMLLPPEARERILARVNAVQQLVGVGVGAGAMRPFDYDAHGVWQKLATHFGYREATRAIVGTLRLAKNASEKFQTLHDAVMTAAESGSGLPDGKLFGAFTATVIDRQAALAAALGDLDPSWDEEFFFRGAFENVDGAFYRIFDGASIGFDARSAPEEFGHKFKAAPTIPRSWLPDAFHRVSKTISTISEALSVNETALFGGSSQLFHMTEAAVGGGAIASHVQRQYRFQDGDRQAARLVQFSPLAGGALVHEIGHGVDASHRADRANASEIERIIREAGIDKFVIEQFSRVNDVVAESYQRYAISNDEIFARSFDAAMVTYALSKGDHGLQSIGGALGTFGRVHDFGPTPAMAAKFLNGVREMVEAKRDLGQERTVSFASAGFGY